MSRKPGSKSFYALTLSVAGTWLAGALSSDEVRRTALRRDNDQRHPVLAPVAVGAGAFGLFCVAARVVRAVPPLDRAVGDALSFADRGSPTMLLATTCANGVAEEIFFRGRLWNELGDTHPVASTTLAYAAVTSATRNPALVAAAAVMGSLFAWQRRDTGSVRAPIITHLTWSVLMVKVLPRFLPADEPGRIRARRC